MAHWFVEKSHKHSENLDNRCVKNLPNRGKGPTKMFHPFQIVEKQLLLMKRGFSSFEKYFSGV